MNVLERLCKRYVSEASILGTKRPGNGSVLICRVQSSATRTEVNKAKKCIEPAYSHLGQKAFTLSLLVTEHSVSSSHASDFKQSSNSTGASTRSALIQANMADPSFGVPAQLVSPCALYRRLGA
jgi:hypothetical protein